MTVGGLLAVWLCVGIYAWIDFHESCYHIFAYLFVGSASVATVMYLTARFLSW